jgi:hypothetical protein
MEGQGSNSHSQCKGGQILQANRYASRRGVRDFEGEGAMLYTIVMMVCMTAVPQTCEQREEMADGLAMNPGVAFMQAQPLVAHWLETHPGYFVQRWRVLPGRSS